MHRYRWLFTTMLLAVLLVVSASGALAQGVQLFAVLNGGNEVSNANPPIASVGDPNGYGSATVLFRGTSALCFAILVNAIVPPTAAHIHEAIAGSNGPVVVDLTAPSTGNPGASSGCVSGLDPVLLRRIRTTPSLFYVNVHNATFPGGAIRGQLF